MLPDWVSNPGPLTYESGALPIELRGPASVCIEVMRQPLNVLRAWVTSIPRSTPTGLE